MNSSKYRPKCLSRSLVDLKANHRWLLVSLLVISFGQLVRCGSWEEWFGYDGFSGPDYWGIRWNLCAKGKRQSPIDIVPEQILFDPTLEPIQIIGNYINATIENNGRGIVIRAVHPPRVKTQGRQSVEGRVLINRGPLSYNYTLDHVTMHYGRDNSRGSEHSIGGVRFPGELQFYFYNSQLYGNWSDAQGRPHGVAAIAVLMQLSNYEHPDENEQMRDVVTILRDLNSQGQRLQVNGLSIVGLMPVFTRNYITYEGSLTQPACSENVEWIVMNKPIYVSSHLMTKIRMSLNGLGDNFRPTQPVLRRCVRTNINFAQDRNSSKDSSKGNDGTPKTCSMTKLTTYRSVHKSNN